MFRQAQVSCFLVFLIVMIGVGRPQADAAQSPPIRAGSPSGLPVPRFVSLKFNKTVCRTGPSFGHPVAFTYLREDLPVRVTAETRDHWRRIEDFDGGECWAHQSTLAVQSSVIVAAPIVLRAQPRGAGAVRAYVEKGVVAELEGRRSEWRLISTGGVTGWAPADALWGGAD